MMRPAARRDRIIALRAGREGRAPFLKHKPRREGAPLNLRDAPGGRKNEKVDERFGRPLPSPGRTLGFEHFG